MSIDTDLGMCEATKLPLITSYAFTHSNCKITLERCDKVHLCSSVVITILKFALLCARGPKIRGESCCMDAFGAIRNFEEQTRSRTT